MALAKEVSEGSDPSAKPEVVDAKTEATLDELFERFMRERVTVVNRPSTQSAYVAMYRFHVAPRLGALPVAALMNLLPPLQKRHGPRSNQVKVLMSVLFAYAETVGWRSDDNNQARRIRRCPRLRARPT